MSTEQNKAVVRRFIEASLNNLDTALVDELFAPDYVNHLVPGGREAFKQFLPMMRSAFPDLKFHNTIEHLISVRLRSCRLRCIIEIVSTASASSY